MVKILARSTLVVASALVAWLVLEGAAAVGSERSLLLHGGGLPAAPARAPTDAERLETDGVYTDHADPRVGYVLRRDAALAILDGQITSDALGMRRRPGAARPDGAPRVVFLGDSVVFGFGVDDHETLAARAEAHLATAGAEVDARTVAVPGWNHRNATSFLLDHLDVYAPDVVVYMPIENDLFDTDNVHRTGHRRAWPDPAAASPWFVLSQADGTRFARRIAPKVRRAQRRGTLVGGAQALVADLSPESSRRYDENAASIVALADVLARRGTPLVLLQWQVDTYTLHLRRRLDERGVDVPWVTLFDDWPTSFTLGGDSHPNARSVDNVARLVARALVELDVVGGDASRVPAVDDALVAYLAPPTDVAARAAASRAERDRQLAPLSPRVDFDTLHATNQLFGGVHADGVAGSEVLVLLGAEGPELEVVLGALSERPDLAPLGVDVAVDDVPVGVVVLGASGRTTARFALPAHVVPGPATPIEVRLSPRRWVVTDDEGIARVASFRPLRIACEVP